MWLCSDQTLIVVFLRWKHSTLQLLATVFKVYTSRVEILRGWFTWAKKNRKIYTLFYFGDSLHSADMSYHSLNLLSCGMLQSYSTCADTHKKGSPCDPCKANTPCSYIQLACLSALAVNSCVYWSFLVTLCLSNLALNSTERKKRSWFTFYFHYRSEKCSLPKMNTWCHVTTLTDCWHYRLAVTLSPPKQVVPVQEEHCLQQDSVTKMLCFKLWTEG